MCMFACCYILRPILSDTVDSTALTLNLWKLPLLYSNRKHTKTDVEIQQVQSVKGWIYHTPPHINTVILGVDLTDTWYRQVHTLASRSASMFGHHTQLLAKPFILAMLGVSYAVPGLLEFFLVVEQPLLHLKLYNHPAHSTFSSSNSAALHPLALVKANHGAWIFALEPAMCLCWFKSSSTWLSTVMQCPNTLGAREGCQGLEWL